MKKQETFPSPVHTENCFSTSWENLAGQDVFRTIKSHNLDSWKDKHFICSVLQENTRGGRPVVLF